MMKKETGGQIYLAVKIVALRLRVIKLKNVPIKIQQNDQVPKMAIRIIEIKALRNFIADQHQYLRAPI